MPSKSALRSAAAAQQKELDAMDEDYLGQYPAKRKKFNPGANRRNRKLGTAKVPSTGRESRAMQRAAAKRNSNEQHAGQAASTRRGKRQRTAGDEEDEEAGDYDDVDRHRDEGDGVDYVLMTQAMNRARRAPQRTINGLGAREYEQPQGEVGEGEERGEEQSEVDDHEENLFMSRSPEEARGLRPNTTTKGHNGASVANGGTVETATRTKNKQTAPRRIKRPATRQRRQRVQNQESSDYSASSSESEGEARGSATADVAEDSAFIESSRRHEKPVLVKINSMGGIFKTLRHQAWTRRMDWDRSFDSDDKSNGDPTACKTIAGKALMKATMSLKRLLEKAIDAWNESEAADEDEIQAATEYLKERSTDTEVCIAVINQAVERICTEELAPLPLAADEDSAERDIQKRQRLLREISRKLIPMLVLVVNKTCGLAIPEDQGPKLTIYFNTFTLQFFLRTLNWTTRLNNALGRGLEQWPFESEFTKDDEELTKDEQTSKEAKIEAREIFGLQLYKLHDAAKRAERTIQEDAARKAEERRRVANRLRVEEQERLARTAKRREDEEKRQRDVERYGHFARFTQNLSLKPHSMQEKWDMDQAARKRAFQEAFAQGNMPSRGSYQRQDQRMSETVRYRTGHSRVGPPTKNRFEDTDDWDPFLEGPPSRKTPIPSNQDAYDRTNGFGITQRSAQGNSQACRPWNYEEDKILVKSIKYDGTYNLASMAGRLGRSQDDVASKVASLKRGYRARFRERGEEIPAYAL